MDKQLTFKFDLNSEGALYVTNHIELVRQYMEMNDCSIVDATKHISYLIAEIEFKSSTAGPSYEMRKERLLEKIDTIENSPVGMKFLDDILRFVNVTSPENLVKHNIPVPKSSRTMLGKQFD